MCVRDFVVQPVFTSLLRAACVVRMQGRFGSLVLACVVRMKGRFGWWVWVIGYYSAGELLAFNHIWPQSGRPMRLLGIHFLKVEQNKYFKMFFFFLNAKNTSLSVMGNEWGRNKYLNFFREQ